MVLVVNPYRITRQPPHGSETLHSGHGDQIVALDLAESLAACGVPGTTYRIYARGMADPVWTQTTPDFDPAPTGRPKQTVACRALPPKPTIPVPVENWRWGDQLWTARDLDQCAALIAEYSRAATGSSCDMRRYPSPYVRQWAQAYGYVVPGRRPAFTFAGRANVTPALDIPPPVLWRLVQPLLSKTDPITTEAITAHPGWERLNCNHLGRRAVRDNPDAAARAIAEQTAILAALDRAGYLTFEILTDSPRRWRITRTRR